MFLQRSDASRSGDLTLQEFVEYLQKHEKQLHFVFSKLDTNKDGRVTSSEIKVAFKNLGIAISLEEAEKLVSRIDDDNSLDISFEEWRDYLMFHPRFVLIYNCQAQVRSSLLKSLKVKSKKKNDQQKGTPTPKET